MFDKSHSQIPIWTLWELMDFWACRTDLSKVSKGMQYGQGQLDMKILPSPILTTEDFN